MAAPNSMHQMLSRAGGAGGTDPAAPRWRAWTREGKIYSAVTTVDNDLKLPEKDDCLAYYAEMALFGVLLRHSSTKGKATPLVRRW